MKSLLIVFFLIMAGCSGNKIKKTEEKLLEETNRAFNMIEQGQGSRRRKLSPVKKSLPPQVHATKKAARTSKYQSQLKEDKKSTAPQIDERMIEINQNLAFYCMKHSKDKKFSGSEEKCMSFVNKSLLNCQKKHKGADSRLLSCIQKKLNRG